MGGSSVPPPRRRGSGPADPHVGARIEAYVKGAELGPVAEILRASRDQILRRWLDAAHRQSFHAARPELSVADQIPPLFDALIAFLERNAPRGVDPSSPLADQSVRDLARAHAHDRFAQGLAAADVLTEFRLLRQEIGRALRERTEGAGDVLAAELLVHDALDGATTLALAALEAHEAEYHRTAAELAAIVESSSDAIIGKTLDGIITSWNAAAERLYGYTAAEAVGQPMTLIIPADRPDELPSILARIRRGERVEPYETARVRKDGSRLEVSVTISPVRDAAGAVVGASAIARDITERKRAEAALRLRSELIEQAHEAIFAWDLADGITFWNRGAQELYGFSAEEALGQRSRDLLGTPPEQVAAFLVALERDGRWEGELTHTTRDGRRIAVEARLALVTEQGRQHVLEATRDLTVRRAAEERLALLAEAGAVLAGSIEYEQTLANIARMVVPRLADWCVVDVLSARAALERLAVVHADPAKVRLAEELRRRYPAEPDSPYGAPAVLRTGQPELVPEIPADFFERAARDPEQLALFQGLGLRSYMLVPLRARSQVLGVISFVSAESGRRYGVDDLRTALELADRAALAIDNARLYREAQEAVGQREQLLAVVAHDLKNPLMAIKGSADLLRRQASAGRLDPGRLSGRLTMIGQAATAMTAQIGELLDAARLRAGEPLELDRRPTDLVALAHQVATQVQQMTVRHTVDVRAAVPELIGEWDPVRLERVLGNLLGNAVKYSPDGSEIRVEVRREEDQHAWACVEVRDRGIGIPAADLPHIFERYHRAANVVGRFPGEGIGLAGARQVIEQHGGTIDVYSHEGQGSTFTVRLPLAPVERQA
jgi:PAS domain S-box-containing protein